MNRKKQLPLSVSEEKVREVLLRYQADYGKNYSPSRSQIAYDLGVTREWVRVVVNSLKKKGYISISRTGNKPLKVKHYETKS